MKKSLLFILLLITSCNNSNTRKELTISDFNTDFPVGDSITMTLKQTFKIIPEVYGYNIKDSVIFMFEYSDDNVGHCYSLNSGKMISVIANIGHANNEMTGLVNFKNIIFGDSIMLIDSYFRSKTFCITDIITKPVSERACSKIESLEINENESRKIGGGIIFGTYGFGPFFEYEPYKMFFIKDDKDSISFFGDLRPELFNVKDHEAIKRGFFSRMSLSYYKNKVIAAYEHGPYLNVIDIDKKKIDYERVYNKYELEQSTFGGMKYTVESIACNDKIIACIVTKINHKKSRATNMNVIEIFILVYDWKLNPIKRFNFGEVTDNSYYNYYISEDAKHIYFLDSDDEEQRLMVGEIKI